MRTLIALLLALLGFILLIRYTNILTDHGWINRNPGSGNTVTGFIGCISPRGTRIMSGGSVIAYANPRVSKAGECDQQIRYCSVNESHRGLLSGSYQYPTCKVYQPQIGGGKSCVSPRGTRIWDGYSVMAYQRNSAVDGSCIAERRSCNDGRLSGTYRYRDCALKISGSETVIEQYTVHNPPPGEPFVGAKKYSQDLIQPKKIDTTNMLFDTDGKRVSVLPQGKDERNNKNNNPVSQDTSYLNTIIPPMSQQPRRKSLYEIHSGCVTPRGERINQGEKVIAYDKPIGSKDNICQSELRSCVDGKIDGHYSFSQCIQSSLYQDQLSKNIIANQADVFYSPQCTTPRRTQLYNGEKTTAYKERYVISPEHCQAQERTCANGTLGGEYQYSRCVVLPSQLYGSGQKGRSPSEVVMPQIEPFAYQNYQEQNQNEAFKKWLDANIEGTKNFPRDVRNRLSDRVIDLYNVFNN